MSSIAETPRSRSRLTRALVATGAGVALLAAGRGTLAEWHDQTPVSSGTQITSGRLALDTHGEGAWTNIAGAPVTAAALRDGTYTIVPGDALTFTQAVTVTATGDLLKGKLSADLASLGVSGSEELAQALDRNATLSVDGRAQPGLSAEILPSAEPQEYVVAVTVAFDDETDGLTAQGATVNLSDLQLELEQVPVSAGDA